MNRGLSAMNRSSGRFGGVDRAISGCCAAQQARCADDSNANLSRRLALAAFALRNGGGPRRPNAARALCEESDFDERPAAGAPAPAKPDTPPARPYFSSGPCAKPPGWSPQARHRHARPFASRRDGQGAAWRGDRAHACAARASRRLPAGHRPRIRYRRDGDGDLVAAGAAAGDDAGVGELRRGLGDRRRQAAQARCRHPHGGLWRNRGPHRH